MILVYLQKIVRPSNIFCDFLNMSVDNELNSKASEDTIVNRVLDSLFLEVEDDNLDEINVGSLTNHSHAS